MEKHEKQLKMCNKNGGGEGPTESNTGGMSTPVDGSSMFSNSSASSRTTFVSVKSNGLRCNNMAISSLTNRQMGAPRKSLPAFLNARNKCIMAQRASRRKNTPVQMFSNLVSFVRGKFCKNSMREYALSTRMTPNPLKDATAPNDVGIEPGVMHRTRSSLRRPQLLNVRQRNSLCFTATNAVDSQQAQAFELLLNCCKTIDDVAFFRAHPADQLATQMGICPEKLATLLEELYFFMAKCDQLKEAEQRVNERKNKKAKQNGDGNRNGRNNARK